MKRLVAIVAGGDSSEHDVSMRSAEGILSFIDSQKYESYVVEIRRGVWTVSFKGERLPVDRNDFSFVSTEGKRIFEFAFIIIHGTPGENGLLQGYFDLLGIPYSTGGVLVEALTFNKFMLNNFLRAYSEFHVSDSILLRKGSEIPPGQELASRLGLPCFVKPNAGGSSFGVTKVKSAEEFRPAVEKAWMESDEVMVERMVFGTEITCGSYKRPGGEIVAFPVTEVVTEEEFFDYDAKYNGKVQEITPARISLETTARVQAMTKQIYQLLGCFGIIRIDYILSGEEGKEQINLLEINTTPGMTATSFIPQQIRAAGLDIKDILSEIIEGRF